MTVVELLPTILPVEDAEIAAHVKKRFEKRGIKIITDAKVAKVDKTKDGIVAHIEPKTGDKLTDRRRCADLGRRRPVQQREPRARSARA